MQFIFYDTETTGTNIAFDQILQFGAVLTDENFQEIDRFSIRCRLLPWMVPSPDALIVTNISPAELCDRALPTHYEMMVQIRRKLLSWGRAIYIGYNSMHFDEVLLHRAFWQALFPPYLTVSDGRKLSDEFDRHR